MKPEPSPESSPESSPSPFTPPAPPPPQQGAEFDRVEEECIAQAADAAYLLNGAQ